MKYYLLGACLCLLMVPQAFALWNATDSVTGTVGTVNGGATWNSGGYFSFDGVNDYLDTNVAVNYSGSQAVSAWFRNTNGSVCVDGGPIVGRAYDLRIFTGAACEAIANFQNSTDQDRTHYNASVLFPNNTWVHTAWTYDNSASRSSFYTNGVFRSNLTQIGVVQISSSLEWRMGGDPNTGLYLKGDIANVTYWNNSLNQANITHLLNNNTPYCTDLRHWWPMASTNVSCVSSSAASYDLRINITVSNTTIRSIPAKSRGFHTAETMQNPAYQGSTLRNHAKDLAFMDSTSVTVWRKDLDLANLGPSYSGNPSLPLTLSYTYGSNYNVSAVANMVDDAAARGIIIHFVDDGPTRWGADNDSKCNYGAHSPNFDWTSCLWSNYTIKVNAINQFFDAIGCDDHPGTCAYEGRNEGYLADGTTLGAARGVFLYRNTSVTCAQRVVAVEYDWANTVGGLKAYWGTDIHYHGPSVNYGYHPCGVVLGDQLMADYTPGDYLAPDLMMTHEYSSGTDLYSDLELADAAFFAGGWDGLWGVSESGLNSNLENWRNQQSQGSALMESTIYFYTDTSGQRLQYFQFDGSESYTAYNVTNETVRYPGHVMNATKGFDTTGGVVRSCSTTNANVKCTMVLTNDSHAVIMIANRNNSTMLIESITLTGSNVTSGTSNLNASAVTTYTGKIVNLSMGRYGYDGLNLTIQGADAIPPVISNRTEWTNSTALQVNTTHDEPSNMSFNYGTDYTVLGTRVTVSAFQTAHKVNITGLTPNTNYHYNITICDALANCATYGPYSEYTKNSTYLAVSVTLNSTSNRSSSPLLFYASANHSTSANLTFQYVIFRNGTNYSSYYPNSTIHSLFYVWSFQDSANVTSDEWQCAGSYSFDDYYEITDPAVRWDSYSYLYDDDYSTAGVAQSEGYSGDDRQRPTFGERYCKPTYATNSSLWQSKLNYPAVTANYSIPAACWALSTSNLTVLTYTDSTSGRSDMVSKCLTALLPSYGDNSMGSPNSTNAETMLSIPSIGSNSTISTLQRAFYDSGMYWAIGGFPSSTAIHLGNVSASALRRGDTYTVMARAFDGSTYSDWTNSTSLTINSTPPNATLVSANVITGGLNCSYTYADYDGDADISTFRWFRNSTVLSSTSQTLTSGNYSINDAIICEVTPKDASGSGTAVNSSSYNPSDTTAPVVSSISYPILSTTTDITRVSAVCTDDYNVASGYPVVSWTNPSGTAETNRSMTLLSASTYYLDYVFLTAGYYSDFKVYCRDGSGNTGNLTNAATMAVVAGSGSTGGGGGGGGGTTVVQSVSGVEIVKPAGKSIDRSCSANQTIPDFEVSLYNPTGSDTTYTFKTVDVTCSAIPALSVPAKQTRTVTVKGCECGGVGETLSGSIDIIDARSPSETIAALPITLREDILAKLLTPKAIMIIAALLLFFALGIGLVNR